MVFYKWGGKMINYKINPYRLYLKRMFSVKREHPFFIRLLIPGILCQITIQQQYIFRDRENRRIPITFIR